jgi:hypothetical protein
MTTQGEGFRIFSLLGRCEKLGCQATANNLTDAYALNMLDVQAIQNGSMSPISGSLNQWIRRTRQSNLFPQNILRD